MGIFSGLKDTKAAGGQRDPVARPGRYLCRVDSFKLQNSQKPPKKPLVVAEFTIVHVLDENTGLAHPVGHESVELILSYGPGEAMFLPKVQGFLKGVLNQDADDDDAESASSSDEPLKGIIVEMSAATKPYKCKKTGETKMACNRVWHRSLSKSEAETTLTAEEKTRFFRNGLVENPFAPDEQTAEQNA